MQLLTSKYLFILTLLSALLCYSAQKSLKITTSAAEMFLGDTFELKIVLENFESDVSIKYPDFKDLRKISGPYQSSSTSIINGNVTKSLSLSYRFAPTKTGTIKVGPASVKESGKTFRSNILQLKVHPRDSKAFEKQKEMFILTDISDNQPYRGEMIRIDYTLYVKPGINISLPSLAEEPKYTGFLKDNIEYSRDKARSLVQKIYKGAKYNTLPVKSIWLTPTSTGNTDIEGITLNVPVEVRTNRRSSMFNDPFFDDDFFSSGFKRHKDTVVISENLKISVKPLPGEGKPGNFTGAVGKFSLSSDLNKDKVKVNEAVNLKVTVSGTGNLKNISLPDLGLPADFEIYDPKRTENIVMNREVTGRIVFEYLLLPRAPGEQKISKINFSYFDLSKNKYTTLSTGPYTITVTGSVSSDEKNRSFSRRDVEMVGSDIRFIKKQTGDLHRLSEKYPSAQKYIFYILISLLLPVLSVFLRSYIEKNSSDTAMKRRKKAAKEANARLKKARSSIDEDYLLFYRYLNEAVLKFLADKFNISHKGIIVEDIINILKERGVDPETLEDMKELMDRISSIQYASHKPGNDEMETDADKCSNIMQNLNPYLK